MSSRSFQDFMDAGLSLIDFLEEQKRLETQPDNIENEQNINQNSDYPIQNPYPTDEELMEMFPPLLGQPRRPRGPRPDEPRLCLGQCKKFTSGSTGFCRQCGKKARESAKILISNANAEERKRRRAIKKGDVVDPNVIIPSFESMGIKPKIP